MDKNKEKSGGFGADLARVAGSMLNATGQS
jgi:hypothetical protein